MRADVFLDTNVLLYLLSGDSRKADRAESLVHAGATISVQVLNEFAAVALRKLKMDWNEINAVLNAVRSTCTAQPLTAETHDCGCKLAQRYQFSVYDSMIVASALTAGCTVLYSEDMHDGLCVQQLAICNPFVETGR